MTETIQKLLQLQEIDAEIYRLGQELERIPQELRKEQAAYELAVRELKREEAIRRRLGEERVREEMSVASSAERIRQLKAKQGQVKKNQEYQALTHEIQMAEESNQKHRAALARAREQEAAADAAVAQRQDTVAARKEEFMKRAAAAKEEVKRLQERIRACREERKKIAAGINGEALALYEKLLKSRAPMVLVAVDKETKVCKGCNIQLTDQVVSDLMMLDRLVTCETCARILYLENSGGNEGGPG